MIEVQRLTIRSGEFELANLSISLAAGEYAVLMGPSGCGKTTLLEALCGLRRVVSGQVLLRGQEATHRAPRDRAIGYVPQDGALFSTMDVRSNLAYGLERRGMSRSATNERVREVASLLCIEHLLARSVKMLSGGEARRVAIGRAIGFRPDLLLLDEPLTGLDDAVREEVYVALETARAATRAAVLHVTHDLRDAQRLADRILRIDAGQLHESTPATQLPAPAPAGEQSITPPAPARSSAS